MGLDMASLFPVSTYRLLLLLGAASAALLAGAWWFELWVGLLPCKLCLEQRQPHYAALGVSVAAMLILAVMDQTRSEHLALTKPGPTFMGNAPERGNTRVAAWFGFGAFMILTLLFMWSTWLGTYHAGVEWGWFAGPNDCGGAVATPAASMPDFMKQLQSVRVVSCTEAAWRLAGLSLAGWNALFSLALAGLALVGTMTTLRCSQS
jgi:disulfide bond formation protein DsbB